jgi:hypothetical protein
VVSARTAEFAGFTVEQLTGGPARLGLRPGDPPALWELAESLSRPEVRSAVEDAVVQLTNGVEPLLHVSEVNGVVRVRLAEMLEKLLARGPPPGKVSAPDAFVDALVADPATVLRDAELGQKPADAIAKAVFDAARRVVWARTAARAWEGWRAWLPLSSWLSFSWLPFSWLSWKPLSWKPLSWKPGGQAERLHQLGKPVRAAAEKKAAHKALRREWEALQRWHNAVQSGSWRKRFVARWGVPERLRSLSQPDLDARWAELEEAMQTFEEKLKCLDEELWRQMRRAWSLGAMDGLTNRRAVNAVDMAAQGWVGSKFALILGFFNALPGETQSALGAASQKVGENYGHDALWLNTWDARLSNANVVFGLGAAFLAPWLTRSMTRIMLVNMGGMAALAVMSLGGGLVEYAAAALLISMWYSMVGATKTVWKSTTSSVSAESRSQLEANYQSGNRLGSLLPILVFIAGFAIVGFGVTVIVMAALFAVFNFGVWWHLRDAGPVQARVPPLSEALAKQRKLVRATRGGWQRLLFSMPVGNALSTLYMYGLAWNMAETVLRMNMLGAGTGSVWLLGAISLAAGVAFLRFGSRTVQWLAGLPWVALERFLGTRGAWKQLFGREVPDGPIDHARVLVSIAVLGAVPLIAAWWWMYREPGLWPMLALTTIGAVFAGWARTPLDSWTAGPAAATLNQTSKGVAVAIGNMLSNLALGATATALLAAVGTGAGYDTVRLLVDQANLWLGALVLPVAVLPVVWALGVRHYRVTRLTTLVDDLAGVLAPADHDRLREIVDILGDHSYGDLGAAEAVFVKDARPGHEQKQQQLRAVLEPADLEPADLEPADLEPADLDLFRQAVATWRTRTGSNGRPPAHPLVTFAAAAARTVSRNRFGAVAVAGGVAVAGALLLGGGPSLMVGVVAAVVGVVLVMLLHHVWAHGPPWVRWTVKALVVLAVTAAVLTLVGSAAQADTGTPAEPAQGTHSDAGGLMLLAGVAAAVVLWVVERKAEPARRLMARVGSFVVGGVLGFVVVVAFGGWVGLAAAPLRSANRSPARRRPACAPAVD